MTHEFTADLKTFWIAHGPEIHHGELQVGEHVSSGQQHFKTFTSRRAWMARVIELGGSFK